MDDWNTILNELLSDNDDTGGKSPYFGPLDEDITPISYNELLQYPLYDNEYKPAKYRRKRSFCDRYGNCGKRSGGKSVSKQHDQSNSIINHNGHSDDAFNENLGRGDETDLTEFYTSNEVLPTLKTFLGRKHVSKKHSPLMSVVKRSLNRSSDQKDKEFETTATKLNEKVYEKIRQYCLTHVCKIKPNIKPNRSNFKTTENDLTGTGNNGVKLDVMSRLKALLKERSRARNDVIDGNKHLNAKRANPFCPPRGCGRRRRKVSVSLDGLKEELKDLLGTRFTRLRYRKIRPKSVESSAPGEWTFERKQRLSLFCPYGGCRGRQ